MFYVYIITSKKDSSRYVGVTKNLKNRLSEHNNLETKSNKSKAPYILSWYCAFNTKIKAYDFEKYLKSSSGFAFRNKRLL